MTNDIKKEDSYLLPDLQLTVTTYELVGDNQWVATLSHTFHGSTQEELYAIMDAHKTTDSFFKSSFQGEFKYKGGIIYLRNSEPQVLFP